MCFGFSFAYAFVKQGLRVFPIFLTPACWMRIDVRDLGLLLCAKGGPFVIEAYAFSGAERDGFCAVAGMECFRYFGLADYRDEIEGDTAAQIVPGTALDEMRTDSRIVLAV